MKLFITGGHATPAIAVIEEIKKRFPDWEIVFVGRKYAMEGDINVSSEYRLIKEQDIRFLPISAGRIQRSFTRYTLLSMVRIISGFIQAILYIRKEKPSMIVSFGGYVAVPIVLAGWFFNVPIITHEQTRTYGLANRFIGIFSKRICISFEDLLTIFPNEKTVYTGLPIRKELFTTTKHPLFSYSPAYPLIYIAGGSTGSESINVLVSKILPDLLKTYTIIHQTGFSLPAPCVTHPRYHVFSYISVSDLSWIYQHAKLYIGRSGANTVAELALLGIVAICIPLPWSGGNEQYKNARFLEQAGSAVILNQKDVTPDQLMKQINEIFRHFSTYEAGAHEMAKTMPKDGAKRFVTEIQRLLS